MGRTMGDPSAAAIVHRFGAIIANGGEDCKASGEWSEWSGSDSQAAEEGRAAPDLVDLGHRTTGLSDNEMPGDTALDCFRTKSPIRIELGSSPSKNQ